ncbi:MAG: hypothetical protein JWL98_1955 [Xanthomonadaceae bacterium]|nr:hypothetical protein [Xanthomonadaceae bacterium]
MTIRIASRATVAALLLCLAPLANAGDFYHWKDAKGVSHYADAPPPRGTFQTRGIQEREGAPAAPADVPAKPKVSMGANCSVAQANLDHLKTAGPVGLDANGDGKPDAPMSDDERARQITQANKDIHVFCKQTATLPVI